MRWLRIWILFPLLAPCQGVYELNEADGSNWGEVPVFPPRASWDAILEKVTSSAAAAPCSAPLLLTGLLRNGTGLAGLVNHFVEELALAVYGQMPVALCAHAGSYDVWTSNFEAIAIPRCRHCNLKRNWQDQPWALARSLIMLLEKVDRVLLEEIKRFLFRRVLQFREDTLSRFRKVYAELGLAGTPYVGVHIRRGVDKLREVPHVASLEIADQIKWIVPKGKVFLATDSSQERERLQGFLGSAFDVVEQPRLPEAAYRIRGVRGRCPMRRDLQYECGAVARELAETHFLVDALHLIHATAFVGTASSWVGRFVFLHRDSAAPTLALDRAGNFLGRTVEIGPHYFAKEVSTGLVVELQGSMYTGSNTWHASAGPDAEVHGASGETGVVAIDVTDGRYVTVPVDINPVLMPSITMELCIKLHSIANEFGWAMGHDEGGYGRFLVLHDTRFGSTDGVGHVAMAVGKTWISSLGPPLVGVPFHVVGVSVQGGDSFVVYDGVKSNTVSSSAPPGCNHVVIGQHRPGVAWAGVDGEIYTVRIYDRVLSNAEIFQNMGFCRAHAKERRAF